ITYALTSTGLLSYFVGRIFRRSLVNKGKRAPYLFLYAANALNVAPKNCLVIEDSQPGIAAAKAADMRYFHYTGGAHLQNCIVTSDNTINSWDEFYSRIPDIFDMRKIR
ncbi:MAG: HAD-IA family hydrolase, partial [Pseudomonadota bacterium]|nr:HAD-IA family hydrolase [Pseudomonadota bacterium]